MPHRHAMIDTSLTRRGFLAATSASLATLAATPRSALARETAPHHNPRAKRVIWLFQSGGPAQQDLFDPKPILNARHGEPLPDSVRQGQRLTGMSAQQSALPLAGSAFSFAPRGQCGMELSELLPHHAKIADKICLVRSMVTEAINHDPAITFFQTGAMIAGRPSFGSWLSYGLGSVNRDLPPFVVLVTPNKGDQPLYSRLWSAGFLPSEHQGVQLRANGVLFLDNPTGLSRESRRAQLDALARLDRDRAAKERDPEIDARREQYELAYRMQESIPEAMDLRTEPDSTFALYGEDARTPGSFASNCVLARRLAERDVRFIQLYHQGWDQHDNLPGAIRGQCKETDQAAAALLLDLEQRGLLADTLVIFGGEFGRTSYCQGKLTPGNYGRDHHPRCFSLWLAGAGIKQGHVHGATDDFSYNIARDPVPVHDLQATILHLLGVDHERLTFRYQGRDYRLTDVHGKVVEGILA
jgi:Protein of unknown function (DUF1501)